VRSERLIPGLARLLGSGVYRSMPARLPPALRDGRAMVAGAMPEAADAVLRLAGWYRSVTFVTPMTGLCAFRGRSNVTTLRGFEIVCVDGIGQLECVVVRKIRTGAISAHGVTALFLLQPPE
jgi:hypothetical protein